MLGKLTDYTIRRFWEATRNLTEDTLAMVRRLTGRRVRDDFIPVDLRDRLRGRGQG